MRGALYRPKLSESVSFRCSEELFQWIQEQANREGASPGDWVRWLVDSAWHEARQAEAVVPQV